MDWTMYSEILGIDQSGCHILSARHVLTLVVGVSCPVCTRYTHNSRTCVKHTHFQHPIFLIYVSFPSIFSSLLRISTLFHRTICLCGYQCSYSFIHVVWLPFITYHCSVKCSQYRVVVGDSNFVLNFLHNPVYNKRLTINKILILTRKIY